MSERHAKKKINSAAKTLKPDMLLPSFFLSYLCPLWSSSPLCLCVALALQSAGMRTVCGMWIKTAPGTTASTALSSHSAVGTATGATAAWTPSRWSQSGSRNAACSSSSGEGSSRVLILITYSLIYLTPRLSVCIHNSRLSLQDRLSLISIKQTDSLVSV